MIKIERILLAFLIIVNTVHTLPHIPQDWMAGFVAFVLIVFATIYIYPYKEKQNEK